MALNFELGQNRPPTDPEGDRYSSCGSLSFVITEDADIENIPEPSELDNDKTSNDVDVEQTSIVDQTSNVDQTTLNDEVEQTTMNPMISYMTQSQYAQVNHLIFFNSFNVISIFL